ncbi:hypothetical protein AN958_11231 [Leucoagaricus sp. SymC.cos]|nr:hypothetical protein AN958_11231 [Leucoagaricus sp. SymC.cos]
MPEFDGISVTIRVDGVDIPEYSVEKDVENKKVTCWVPSQVGKAFKVMAHSEEHGRGPWSAEVYADGTRVISHVFPNNVGPENIGFHRETSSLIRPLVFSPVELVDDDALLSNASTTRIGEIEIECSSVEILQFYNNPEYSKKDGLSSNQKLHEKAKKGISHHVGVGAPSSSNGSFCKAKIKEYIVTFVFRYRSLDYLQAQGIAPLDRPPRNDREDDPLPGDVKEELIELSDGDSDDEIRTLKAKLDEAKARKRKRGQDNRSASKKVKKEDLPRFLPGEVIDLT